MFKRQFINMLQTHSKLICASSSKPYFFAAALCDSPFDVVLIDCRSDTHITPTIFKQDFDLYPYVVFSSVETLIWKTFTAQVDHLIDLGATVIILTEKPMGKFLKCFKHRLAQQPLLLEV